MTGAPSQIWGDTTYVGVQLSERLTDARTLKAILLTSANRRLPGWDNGQATVTVGRLYDHQDDPILGLAAWGGCRGFLQRAECDDIRGRP